MSKSLGNYIGVEEPADEIFGKVMSIPDTLMARWYQLLLGERPEIIIERIQRGENPRDLKVELGRRLVMRFWGDSAAEEAKEHFDRTFRKREVPEDSPVIGWTDALADISALQLVATLPDMPSRQEARRLLTQGAVTISGQRVLMGEQLHLKPGDWIKVGKRRYYRIQ